MKQMPSILLCVIMCFLVADIFASPGIISITAHKSVRSALRTYQRIMQEVLGPSFVRTNQFHITLDHLYRYNDQLKSIAQQAAQATAQIKNLTFSNAITTLATPAHRTAIVLCLDQSSRTKSRTAKKLFALADLIRKNVRRIPDLQSNGPTTLPFIPHMTLGFINSDISDALLAREIQTINARLASLNKVTIDARSLIVWNTSKVVTEKQLQPTTR